MELNITNLTVGYGQGPNILHGVNLSVQEGEIVTIIGPNGAGKSTVLKSIFGLTDIRHGKIFHDAREITGFSPDRVLRSGISFVMQGHNVFPELTVEENLQVGTYVQKGRKEYEKKKEEVCHLFPVLKKFLKKPAGILSGGERQMIALGMALMLSPELLLLDGPSIGLAPQVVDEVFDRILHIREAGTSLLMVEQNAAKALEISDRGYVLELGKNALQGNAKKLLQDKRIGELYLGGHMRKKKS